MDKSSSELSKSDDSEGDATINKILSLIYYDPGVGYVNAKELWMRISALHIPEKLKESLKLVLNYEYVKQWVSSQRVTQVFRRNRVLPSHFRPIVADRRGVLQVDLADLTLWEKFNRGYGWLLFAIDIFSRKLWLVALKNKTAESVLQGVKVLKEQIKPLFEIECDEGPEFTNHKFVAYLDKHDIKVNYAPASDKKRRGGGHFLGVVDRVMRTYKKLLQLWFVSNEGATHTREWLKIYNELADNYNNRYHTTLEATPNQVWFGEKLKAAERLLVIARPSIEVGDTVRYLRDRGLFDKETKVFSKNVFTVIRREGHRYYLNEGYKSKPHGYRDYELQKVEGDAMNPPIERAMQHSINPAQRDLRAAIKRAPFVRKQMRFLNREGIDKANIIAGKRK